MSKHQTSYVIPADQKPGEDLAVTAARTMLQPKVGASLTIKDYVRASPDIEMSGLVEALTEQTQSIVAGDLTRPEEMLTVQAHTLDAIFNNLAQRANRTEYMDNLDSFLKLALRAQSQCRATLESLAAMKNPPMVGFIKQANITQGPQQVNNSSENQNPETKLLEKIDGKRLDFGAQGTAGGVDQEMATVEKIDRTKDSSG